jgi:hypothetical protein
MLYINNGPWFLGNGTGNDTGDNDQQQFLLHEGRFAALKLQLLQHIHHLFSF